MDLTLEQTVNKDAASRQTGIAAFTQCVNARKRWTVTRSMRGSIVGCLLEMAGMTNQEGISQELKPYRIQRDNNDLQTVVKGLEEMLNPFTMDDDKLYCLTTGRAASTDVMSDLLTIVDKGTMWYEEFLTGCKDNADRFDKPIKHRKVKNFANDALTIKVAAKDQKIKEVRCTRDLFGRLLFLAASQNVDLGTVLSHPLTPVPLSLCHITGAMNKTDKSTLMKKLEAKSTNNEQPANVDVYLIDAMFFLRTLPSLPPTFGGIAMVILQHACSFAQVIHIICDTYKEGPSIKEQERDSRGDYHTAYKITGSSQQRPTDFHCALQSATFKTSLLRFLRDEWTSQTYASMLEGHTLYFALEQHCYTYMAADGIVHRSVVDVLESMHEEADTRLIFHAQFVAEYCDESPQIAVRSSDTDVFILLLHYATHLEATLWMDTGVSSRNTRRVINISDLAHKLTPTICSALPGIHAFTGCDYTASFLRKGKVRPYELMAKDQKFTSAFSKLGVSDAIDDDVVSTIEVYVCAMYGVRNVEEVNEARLHVFR